MLNKAINQWWTLVVEEPSTSSKLKIWENILIKQLEDKFRRN